MGLSCGVAFIKYVLFAFNLIFTLFSIALIAIGAVQLIQLGDLSVADNLQWFPIVLIIVGVASFLIAFFGCCGAIRESICLIYSYSTFLMILLIIQVVVAAIVLVKMDDLIDVLKQEMQQLWENRNQETQFWDAIQSGLRCCGLNAPSEWGSSIPRSCCDKLSTSCSISTAFTRGCSLVANDEFTYFGHVLAYVALGAAVVQLIGFIFSCILVNSVRNQNRRATY